METQIIVLFCFVDDYLKVIGFKDDVQAQMSSAEIITIAIAAGMFFGGNHEKSRMFFSDYKYVNYMLSKSQFNRRLHAIDHIVWQQLQYILGQIFKERNQNNEYILDSFPISVCENIRISRCKIYRLEEYRGYSASKRKYFYGIKVHMIATAAREPIEFIFAPGSMSDTKIFKQFDFDLPKGSNIYGDAAYNDYEQEDVMKEAADLNLMPDRKSNMTRQHKPFVQFMINYMRKNIETAFSQITGVFPKKIHAVTAQGFELKVFFFIVGYSIGLL